jgi:hypothetical protein
MIIFSRFSIAHYRTNLHGRKQDTNWTPEFAGASESDGLLLNLADFCSKDAVEYTKGVYKISAAIFGNSAQLLPRGKKSKLERLSFARPVGRLYSVNERPVESFAARVSVFHWAV